MHSIEHNNHKLMSHDWYILQLRIAIEPFFKLKNNNKTANKILINIPFNLFILFYLFQCLLLQTLSILILFVLTNQHKPLNSFVLYHNFPRCFARMEVEACVFCFLLGFGKFLFPFLIQTINVVRDFNCFSCFVTDF